MTRLAAALAFLLALVCAPVMAAPTFPDLTGRVVDDAHVLSPQVQADLTSKLAALEQTTSRQLVVVTVSSLGGVEIPDYGNQLLRHWGIGQKGTNNGALFIIAPTEHKVRVEVGYGLEGVLTDAVSSVILHRHVLPAFRTGDFSGGITAGTEALIAQLGLDPSTAEAKAAQAEQDAAAYRAPAHHRSPLNSVFVLMAIAFIVSSLFRRRGAGGGGMGWLLPMMILGGSRGGGWGNSDGGGGGGFGDSGGFSGGGGSGGGGGADGSW